MGLPDDDLLGKATALARRAGRPDPVAVERLAGGRNNQVYRLVTSGGAPLFLKSYFHDPRDTRARLAAEWSFLEYAWQRGIRSVPEPIAADPALQLGLYEFVEGRAVRADDVGWPLLEVAAGFILDLNRAPRDIAALPIASEACMSVAEHVATVDRRVNGLQQLHPDVPHREAAAQFIARRLVPTWQAVRERVLAEAKHLDRAVDAPLDAAAVIASPSDFGFHNMLVRPDGTLAFTDFEYAGRDDPAKLVCDFFAQPDMPAPMQFFDAFIDKLAQGLDLSSDGTRRCRLLLDAYRVKWACIILNDFRPIGATQRAFARADSWAQRCVDQLAKAEAKISQISNEQRGVVS